MPTIAYYHWHRRAAGPPPIPCRLAWLRRLLERDEQARPRPPITLPGRRVDDTDHPPSPPPLATPVPKVISFAAIVNVVALHFGLRPEVLFERRGIGGRRRPLPTNIAAYLIRTRTPATYDEAAAELGTGVGRPCPALIWSMRGTPPPSSQHFF